MSERIEGIDDEFQKLGEMLKSVDFSEDSNKDEIYDKTLKSIKCKEGKKMIRNKYKKLTAVAASLLIISTILVRPTWAEEMMRKLLNQVEFGDATAFQFDNGGVDITDDFAGQVFDADGNELTVIHPYDKTEKLYTKDGKEIFELKHGDVITMDEKKDYVLEITDKDKVNDIVGFTVNMPEYMPEGYEFESASSEKYRVTDTIDHLKGISMTFKDSSNNTIGLTEYYSNGEPLGIMQTGKIEKIKVNGVEGTVFEDGTINWEYNGIVYSVNGNNVDKDTLIKIAESLK